MNPKAVIDQLSKLRNWNRMTAVKREAIDKAIKAVEAHEVAKECIEKKILYTAYKNVLAGRTEAAIYTCPCCNSKIGYSDHKGLVIPNYCPDCGQKLKAPEE